MKPGKQYNNQNIIPNSTLSENLQEVLKIKKCTCSPVFNDRFIVVATLDEIILLNINSLDIIKTIELANILSLSELKNEYYIYMFLLNDEIIIQYFYHSDNKLFKVNFSTLAVERIANFKGVAVINHAIKIDDSLYFTVDDDYSSIQRLDINTFELHEVIKDIGIIKFLTNYQNSLIFTDNQYLYKYDLCDNKILFKVNIAQYGAYIDQLWDQENSGEIELDYFIQNHSIVVPVLQAKILSINLIDGSINWICQLLDNTNSIRIEFRENQKTFTAISNDIFEIDLNGNIIKSNLVWDKLKNNSYYIGPFYATENYIFATTTLTKPALIVLSYFDGSVKRYIELDNYCYEKPLIINSYLVLLDIKRNLIFLENK